MMAFFKRKNKEDNVKLKDNQEVNKSDLLAQIDQYLLKIKNDEAENQPELLNKLGELYFKIADYDHAIMYYEKSLEQDKKMGNAFTDLVKLYNLKRKEASAEGDKEKVQEYLKKSDDLMKLTKDTIRGNM